MLWYFPWSENIKKRACRYLLQRYLGNFLEEKLTLDQLSVDLYNGTGTVSDVSLDCDAINELGDSQSWPIEIVDGYMQQISVSIPWSTLLKDDSLVEVHGLSITVQPKMRPESSSSMLESMWSSSMSSSMQLAAECLQQENEPQDTAPLEGIEMFAHAIDSVLSKVKVKLVDTKIRIEHVPKNSKFGVALEIHIKNINYLDEAGLEPSPELIDTEKNKTYVVATFSSKKLYFEGVNFYTSEYPSNARTISRSLLLEKSQTQSRESENIAQSVNSDVFYESCVSYVGNSNENSDSSDSIAPTNESDKDSEPDNHEDKVQNDIILFAKLTGRQEMNIRAKMSDEASGPKIDFQMTFGSLVVYFCPRQLHLLIDLVNGLCSPHLEDTSNLPSRTPGANTCKPMNRCDFERVVEAQLLEDYVGRNRTNNVPTKGWGGINIDDSEPESERFLPMQSLSGGDPMMDSRSSTTSNASMSTITALTNIPRYNNRVPQVDGDPTAEVSHITIRMASCSCVLLHKDIITTEIDGSVTPSSVKEMQANAVAFFENLGLFAIGGYGNKDFELANKVFDNATNASHIRLIAASITLEGNEKISSQGCVTNGHITLARVLLREMLYQDFGPTETIDLIKFIRKDDENTEFGMNDPLSGLPDARINFKLSQKVIRIGGEKKYANPISEFNVELRECAVEIDVRLYERVYSALHPYPRTTPSPHHTSNPGSPHSTADVHTSSLLNVTITAPELLLIIRFPAAEIGGRGVRKDAVLLNTHNVTLYTDYLTPSTYSLRASTIDIYYTENINEKGIHIGCATEDDTVEGMRSDVFNNATNKRQPTIKLTFRSLNQGKSALDSSSDEEVPLNTMYTSAYLMDKLTSTTHPSPFSSKKISHRSDTPHERNNTGDVEELLVPGNASEMNKFAAHSIENSSVLLDLDLPVLSLQLQSKQLYEIIYNRINTDLLLWEPKPPSTHSYPFTSMHQTQFTEPNIYPAFSMCKSGLAYASDTESSTSEDEEEGDNIYFSTYENKIRHKLTSVKSESEGKGPHDFCLLLNVGKGILTFYVPVRDSSSQVLPMQSGEIVIIASDLSMCSVSGVRGNAKTALMSLMTKTATLYHCDITPESLEKPVHTLRLYGSSLPSYLKKTVYPSGKGISVKGGSGKDILRLALSVQPHKDLNNFKKIKVALGIEGGTVRHRWTKSGMGGWWVMQLMDAIDVKDYPVPGYIPAYVLTELHLHLWDVAIDYRPIYLPLRTVLTLGSFSISSNVIANTNTSNLHFIAQDCSLYLSQVHGFKQGDTVHQDEHYHVNLQKDYVRVIELGLFELSLRLTEKRKSCGVDVRASNNVVVIETCCDSAAALSSLISYLASNGDLPGEESTSQSVIEEGPGPLEDIREMSPGEATHFNTLMMEAMEDCSKNHVLSDEEQTLANEKEGVEVYFFPDESNNMRTKRQDSTNSDLTAPIDEQTDQQDECKEECEPTNCEDEDVMNSIQEDIMKQLDDASYDRKSLTPSLLQVTTELGDFSLDVSRPDRQAKTSEGGGSTDDEYCIIEPRSSQDEDIVEPHIKWFQSDPVVFVTNHFTVPLAKNDVLKPPNNFPNPIVRYTLCEMTIIWHLYGGHDFKKPTASNNSPCANRKRVVIDERATVTSGGSPVLARFKADGDLSTPENTSMRDKNLHVEIELAKIKFQHEDYPVECKQASRQTLAIGKVEIRDRLAMSSINKLLAHHVDTDRPTQTHAHMVVVKAVHLRSEPSLSMQECCLKVSLLPLRFHIDQDTLLFLIQFFSNLDVEQETALIEEKSPRRLSQQLPVMSLASNLQKSSQFTETGEPLIEKYEAERLVSDNLIQLEEDLTSLRTSPTSQVTQAQAPINTQQSDTPLYFRRVVFSPDVAIRLDYVSKRVDLSQGPIAGLLMGLAHLNCSELTLKRLSHRHGILGIDKLIRWAVGEWLNDIKKNQLSRILKGIGPMHSLWELLSGVVELFSLPVAQWKRDGRLALGIRRGAAAFTARTALAAIDITTRLLAIVQAAAESALDMVSPRPPRRRRIPHPPPADIRQGVTDACTLLREGIAEHARMVQECSTVRALPAAAVAPLALAAAASASLLGGVRHHIAPPSHNTRRPAKR